MNLNTVKVETWEARRQYFIYREQAKRDGAPAYMQDLKRAYWHMAKGAEVIDVLAAFQKGGMSKNSPYFPAFALAPATATKVFFEKSWNNTSAPDEYTAMEPHNRIAKKVLEIPIGTFPLWPRNPNGVPLGGPRASAPVPIVPGPVMAKLDSTDLSKFHILWEVETWSPEPPADPFLLRRISKYLFVIIAHWDCTPLEQSVVRARGTRQ